ncbi:hypothetical protein MASR2M79_18750 [Aminivibrio sp.]
MGLRTMDSLHKNRRRQGVELILISEAFHARNLGNIAAEISSRKSIKVVLIAGPSGSGKTTFRSG